MSSKLVVVRTHDPSLAVPKALDELGIQPDSSKVVIKPNLIWDAPPPVTTPVDLVIELAKYFSQFGSKIIVAEGSGWCETPKAFSKLGYSEAAAKYGFELVDLNNDQHRILSDPGALVLKAFQIPLSLLDCYLISAAVLKRHSLTKVSLSLKNLLGASLGEPRLRAKKLRFHKLGLDESILDLARYLKPKLGVIDARMGCLGGELGGRSKRFGLMLFSQDLVALDGYAARLLGYDPHQIQHLKLAESLGLGSLDLDRAQIIEY